MNRFSALAFSLVTIIAAPALGDAKADHKDAGKKGFVSAYEADQVTVMDVQSCDLKGLAHDYPECGKALRERVKKEICEKKGKGKHTWYYQISDGKKSKHDTNCK